MDTKEAGLFKAAIKFYESKQYKRGLKNCEQILKKYPDHGETLALKGLFTLYLGKREEGFEICKGGLKLSLQSHVSWHILGLMYRYDKNYEEAIKCYKSALRIDKDNFQIQRDLALLQLQCRQYEGIIDTRKKILLSKPTAPFNWISIVIAYHMAGNLRKALDTLNAYLDLFTEINDPEQEHLYYKISIMAEKELFTEAVTFMKSSMKRKNTRRYLESFARVSFGAKLFDECESAIRKLLDINPDNREYFQMLVDLYRQTDRNPALLFDEMCEKSIFAGVEFLHVLDDEAFDQKAPVLVENLLKRSSPATFSLFKRFMNCGHRREIIWSTVQKHIDDQEVRSCALAFAAHYESALGNQTEALKYADLLIQAEPAQKGHLLLKARILKRSNSPQEGLAVMQSETESFLKDKFSASKVAKYEIRFGQIGKAQEIIASFIQKPTLKEQIGDLHEMQAAWYLIEMADRLLKEDRKLDAACFYRKIELIFNEFIDDQLDFHSYAIRRMAFVDYIKFLRFLDNDLKKSAYLKRALIGQAKIFLSVSEADLSSALSSMTLKTPEFADDISSLQNSIKETISTAKTLQDALKNICNNLLKNHSGDAEALQVCLSIAKYLNAKLLAAKIASNLRLLGHEIDAQMIYFINSDRTSALWNEIPAFN